MSKQAYYKHDESKVLQKTAQESFVLEYVKGIRKKDPGIGGKKLWYMYCREFDGNNPVGRDRFADIIDRNSLKVRQKVRKPRTTDSSHGLPTYPNVIKGFIPSRPNRLWVSDITYITIWIDEYHYVFCYLSLILDAYTEEIVGWSIGPTLETVYPLEALKMALKRIEGVECHDLIHHSDRGSQYCSNAYVELLESVHASISMTEDYKPTDNAIAERVNGIIKQEWLYRMKRPKNMEEARKIISGIIDFYNNKRPHMSNGMMTPRQKRESYTKVA